MHVAWSRNFAERRFFLCGGAQNRDFPSKKHIDPLFLWALSKLHIEPERLVMVPADTTCRVVSVAVGCRAPVPFARVKGARI